MVYAPGHVAPFLSIVIPVYNEEAILADSVRDLRAGLLENGWPFELLLAENGSKDRTVDIAQDLARQYPEVHVHSLGQPNYGLALKQGILRATGTFVVCDEIDLCDLDFYRRALHLLEAGQADLVVGSKVMAGASDDRPLVRHAATLVLNQMLKIATGFKGTDTHGLKAFRREALLDVVDKCVVDKDLFASELVIRAWRARRVAEIPLRVAEKRAPSINLFKRVPNVLKNMVKLGYVIRVRHR